MEGFMTFVGIIAVIWGVLNIVLFFKLWGMTNDVSEIKKFLIRGNTYKYELASQQSDYSSVATNEVVDSSATSKSEIKVGDKVHHMVYDKEKVFIVGTINSDGSCLCLDEKGEPCCTYSINKLVKVE